MGLYGTNTYLLQVGTDCLIIDPAGRLSSLEKLLEDKIVYNTDYEFLNSIKDRFPTNNPYFLVCLTEIIFNHEEDDTKDVLNEFIKEAYDLYKYANISEYLSEISE